MGQLQQTNNVLKEVTQPTLTLDSNAFKENLSTAPRAGFWIRFLAATIDGTVLTILSKLVITLMAVETLPLVQQGMISNALKVTLSLVVYVWPTTMYGCTLGKKVFGLKVVDENSGEELSFGKVLFREYIGKVVSLMILGIGYLMAARADKRALHDKMAGSLVVSTRAH